MDIATPGLEAPVFTVTAALRSALLEVLCEAREGWGRVVHLPVDLVHLHAASPGVPAAVAGLLLAMSQQGRPRVWLAGGASAEPVFPGLESPFAMERVDAPAQADIVALRAADAAPVLWRQLRRAMLLVGVPQLTESVPQRRDEPGDTDLTGRLVVHYPGEAEPRRLAVAGLSRQFWRERAAAQHGGDFDVDLLLTQGRSCCCIPAAALVSVQA